MTESISVFTWGGGVLVELEKGITKGHKETFEGDGYVYYVIYSSRFIDVYTYDKTHEITCLKHTVYYMPIIPE